MARTKGSPNKIGAQVKENIVAVFNRLDGTSGMAKWAKKNLTEFYRLYARLIPTEVIGELTIRDASELSDAELLAIATGSSVRAAESQSSEGPSGPIH